jgi:integrase
MARSDPAGRPYLADAHVFGNVGQRLKSIKRAWATVLLKAHGHTPIWIDGSLSAASRAQLEAINLHFHDLRHEGASRLLEAGWPLHHVQEMLGHSSIQQTSTYLNVTATGLQASMRKSDAARIRCNPVAISSTVEPPLDGNSDDLNNDKGLLH